MMMPRSGTGLGGIGRMAKRGLGSLGGLFGMAQTGSYPGSASPMVNPYSSMGAQNGMLA